MAESGGRQGELPPIPGGSTEDGPRFNLDEGEHKMGDVQARPVTVIFVPGARRAASGLFVGMNTAARTLELENPLTVPVWNRRTLA